MISKILIKFFFLSITVLVASCSIVASSFHFTLGTQCLDKGDYIGAVRHLERAVELDPTMSRNHNSLACAYMGIQEVEKAWYQSRQAVLCEPVDYISLETFMNIYKLCVKNRGLNQKGTSLQEILSKLGEPDLKNEEPDGTITIIYGCSAMKFFNGMLVSCSFKEPRFVV